ncbi:MAG: aminopeptidase P family protein [Gammaproteobacteria bacterium]|nr:aminopeptidase P family protein [Gammaproteobacteria bacterium]NIR81679.1 aminopeptidase P family protein [Gammaproteobacteria bacterium]NIR88242.1 aminopeptidase P family protein [Gammaproteobacteria bacterium]NIU02781.1 aminopeptidase P family protein [Gammaproteobacteria bacterium]NIV50305.1 M24 family metallopeptidase [Gammaproteobacteria bacterium]
MSTAQRADPVGSSEPVDLGALRAYRLARVRGELVRRDYAAAVLYDPVNVRYVTDSRNMALWTMHNAVRYAFVPAEGPVVVFDFHNCEHLSHGIETVDEVRPATAWFYYQCGSRTLEAAQRWADEIADLIRRHGGGNRRLAVDHCNAPGVAALARHGITVHDAQEVLEEARKLKSPQELAAIRTAIATCEAGMRAMRRSLTPGIRENELWAILHHENITRGGEWIETRLLSSGPRTNPWFQESSDRVIRAGELVCFDTDLVGPYSYCADISRAWLAGDGKPTDAQRRLYALAYEQIEHNMSLLKPGASFREISEKAYKLPEACAPNRYSVLAHGIGLCDEYPDIRYLQDFDARGYDGTLLENMTLCVESYIGEAGGQEGIKLEEQVLITPEGAVPLSTYPFEEGFL